jgi:hypothetical protein
MSDERRVAEVPQGGDRMEHRCGWLVGSWWCWKERETLAL